MVDSLESVYKEVQLEVNLPEVLPPISSLLAYYATDDGEVVADSVRIDAQPCLKNQVYLNMDWNNSSQYNHYDKKPLLHSKFIPGLVEGLDTPHLQILRDTRQIPH